jgi:acetylornithine deacetylase
MEPLVRDLAALVAFETVSRTHASGLPAPAGAGLRELAAFTARRAEDLGFTVTEHVDPRDAGKVNVIARAGPRGTDGLVITGHMDVVPTEGQPWSTDPFALHVDGDRLQGRGTADMKGFIAATLDAIGRVDAPRLRRELTLFWTYDEEIGCLGAGQAVADGALGAGPLPRACLVGEPTEFRILRMHAGHVEVEVEVRGRAAHSSRPELGTNAIVAAAAVVRAADELARDLRAEAGDDELARVPLNVGRIEGGGAVNIVPDAVRIRLGYRPAPGMPATAVFERLQERLSALDAPHCGLTARVLRVTPSLLTPAHTALEALLAPYASAPGAGAAPFATDGGQLALAGTQPLVFGPGSIDVAHRADEHVSARALHRASDIVGRLIRARCVDA